MALQEKNKIFSVTELTQLIKSELESQFSACQVQGEVSNYKRQSSGHIYFTLKDSDAQIRCVLFRNTAERLAILPSEGDQLIVYGQVTVYPPQGNYQILVLGCQKQGLGVLLLKLQELKKELLALGWLDQSRKKPLPMMPQRIGVVTSPTGAVIQDIIQVLSRRFGNISLILNPVKVQGEGAKEEIAKAIEDFNRYQLADVLIVARGGGSIEDLWPFNEKIVAEAIYNSKIPVISAVGHETDVTLADLVADVRAPTPSAAAELVMKEKKALFDALDTMKVQLVKNLSHKVQSGQAKLAMMSKHPFFSNPFHIFSLSL